MKKRTSIVGLPRSGTTILNNLLNSIDDWVCLSEPIWEFISYNEIQSLDKLKSNKNISSFNQIIPTIHDTFNNSGYNNLGIKETFRYWAPECINTLFNEFNPDVCVFILRNPLYNYSGWKKVMWSKHYVSVNDFKQCYLSLINLINTIKEKKPTIILSYEELTEKGVGYLKSKLDNHFEIPDTIELKSTNYRLGDQSAHHSTEIKKSRSNLDNLIQAEITVCESLLEIY